MINYTQDLFSQRIRNRSTLIDVCFFLFSLLRFTLVLDFGFYIRKNFIKIVRLKLFRKKTKSRANWMWNNKTDLLMFSQQIETEKVYHRKAHKNLLNKILKKNSKKYVDNLSKFFLGCLFFPWNSTKLFQLSGTGLVLEFI